MKRLGRLLIEVGIESLRARSARLLPWRRADWGEPQVVWQRP